MAGKGNGHNAVVVCGLVAAHNFVKILGAADIHGSALGLVSVLPDFQVQGGVAVLFTLGYNQTAGGVLLGFAGEGIPTDKVNAVGLRRRALLHPPIAGAGIDQTAEPGVGSRIQSAVFHGKPGDGGRGVGPFVAQQAAAGGVGAGGDFQAVHSQAVDGHGLVIASHGSNQAAHRGVRPARVRLVDGAGKGAVCCRDFGFAFAFCAEAAQITLGFGGIDYFPRPPAVGEVCLLGGGEQSRNPASPKVIGLRLLGVQQRSRAAGDLGQGSPALGFGAQCADVQGSVRMGSDTAHQGKIGGGEIRGFCKEALAVVVIVAGVDRDIRQGDGVTVAVQRDADFLGIVHIPLEAGNADVLQIIHIRGQVNGLGRTVLDVAPIKFQGVGFIQLIAQGKRRKFGGTAHRVGALRAVGNRHRDGALGRGIGQHAGQIVGANHLTPAADVIGGALLGVPALIGIDQGIVPVAQYPTVFAAGAGLMDGDVLAQVQHTLLHVAHQATAGTVSGKAGGRHARQPQHMAAAVQLADEAAYVVRRIVVCGAGRCGLLNFNIDTVIAIHAADEAAVGIISVSGEGNFPGIHSQRPHRQRICLVSSHQAAQAVALGGGDGDGLLPLQVEVPGSVFHIAVQTAYVSIAVGQVHVYAGVAGAAVIVVPGFGVGIAANQAARRGAAGNFRGSHLRHTAVQNQVLPEADQAARVLGGRNGTANRDLGGSGQAGKPGSVLHFAHQAACVAAAQICLDGELFGFG